VALNEFPDQFALLRQRPEYHRWLIRHRDLNNCTVPLPNIRQRVRWGSA